MGVTMFHSCVVVISYTFMYILLQTLLAISHQKLSLHPKIHEKLIFSNNIGSTFIFFCIPSSCALAAFSTDCAFFRTSRCWAVDDNSVVSQPRSQSQPRLYRSSTDVDPNSNVNAVWRSKDRAMFPWDARVVHFIVSL